jgi:hypothetical protein
MRVVIYRANKAADRSVEGRAKPWRIEPCCARPVAREPLMGWIAARGSGGTLAGRLRFATAAQAEAFAQREGWQAEILAEPARDFRPQSFMDRFKITRPEDEERAARE